MKGYFRLIQHHKLIGCLVALPFLLLTSFWASPISVQEARKSRLPSKPIKVTVQLQSLAPITITSTTVDSINPNAPSVVARLVNVSKLPVRAYTIRCDAYFGSSKFSNWSLNNIRSLEKAFQPNQTRLETIGDAVYGEPLDSISLSVDFVEFLNGHRWGEDTYKSAERLDGWRAGARAERDSLLLELNTNDPESALNNIQLKGPNTKYPSDASSEYLDGFRLGIDAVRARLLHTKGKDKSNRIITELQYPIDLSDWR